MKIYHNREKVYYKYVDVPTNSPIFNSSSEAQNGVGGVSMTSGYGYYAITGLSSGATIGRGTTCVFDVGENSNGINWVGFIGVVVGGSYPGATMTSVQCSEDGNTWTTITGSFGGRGDYLSNPLQITSPNNYRYLKFTSNVDDSRYSTGGMYRFTINYQRKEVQRATESDYDFYREEEVLKAVYFQATDKYKIWPFGKLMDTSGPKTLVNYNGENKTVNLSLPAGKYYVEIVGAGGNGSYGQAGYWQERYGGGSGARWCAILDVTGNNHNISLTCGGSVGASSTLTIDGALVATAGGGGTPGGGSVTTGSTSITNITFSDIISKSGNQGAYTFTVEGTSTGNAASVASRGTYGQGAASGNGIGEGYQRKAGWIYLHSY